MLTKKSKTYSSPHFELLGTELSNTALLRSRILLMPQWKVRYINKVFFYIQDL